MTIQQYRYVLEIARRGSISEAAKQLFVAQSSLSTSIKMLETELNIKIFERSGGGMIRDLCLREIPFVFNKRIYAVASLVGAALYYALFCYTGMPEYLALLIGVVGVVAIRTVATVFELDMPKAIVFDREESEFPSDDTKTK